MSPAAHTWTPHQITLKRHKWPFHNELPLLRAGGIYSCFHATAASLSLSEYPHSFRPSTLVHSSMMGISYNGWAHTPIQGWWALALRRQLGVNSEVEYSCHWARGLESLEKQWVCCQVIMVTITKRRRHRFWNKVCLAIQLTLGCSHQIPSVSTAERLSVQLGQMPMQYLMLLPLSGACSFADAEADLDASQMKCALCRGSRFWMEIGLPRSPYRRVHYSRAIQDFLIHGSLALFCLSVSACVCAPVMLPLAGWCSKQCWWAAMGAIRGRHPRESC